jgi:hypothetical protein
MSQPTEKVYPALDKRRAVSSLTVMRETEKEEND